jgi:hypothetical protein
MRTQCLGFIIAMALIHSAAHADELTAKELVTARKIYIAKCAKCHRFYEPMNYRESEWQGWMRMMNKKSKLNEEQIKFLTQYLDAYRAGQLPGKPQDKPKSVR